MSSRPMSLLWGLALSLSCSACEPKRTGEPTPEPATVKAAEVVKPEPAPPTVAPEPPPPVLPPASAGLELPIAAGEVALGSETGSADRNPAHEADHERASLGAFAIDALPYPNDPAKAPKGAVTRSEASALCAEQGKRLCSELEWERACKGDREAPYPAQPFDAARCASEPTTCASPFGVFALGTLGREWTASDAAKNEWDGLRTAVVRGAARDAPPTAHRCAARDAATPNSKSESLLFRCCRGEAQSASYPAPRDYAPFRDGEPGAKELSAALEAMPETRTLAAGFRTFSQGELGKALTQGGRSQSSLAPWLAIRGALTWSPVRGEQLVIASGDTPRGSLVVAYYPLAAGQYRFAGSFETKGEHLPILVAYKPDVRDELLFSTCWGCGGEGGAIRLAEDARLRFLPR